MRVCSAIAAACAPALCIETCAASQLVITPHVIAFQFDGMKPAHVLRKYKGRAPSGRVMAGLEVANEDAVIRCTECHAMKGPKAAAASSSLERDSGDEGTSLPELDD